MGILSRLFGHRKVKVDALDLVDREEGTYVFNRDVHTKCRRTKNLPDDLRQELIDVCRKCDFVAAAVFLDVIEPATGDIKFFVTLKLDDPAADLHQVGSMMQQIFLRYPDYSQRFYIGSETFGPLELDHADYVRDAA